MKPEWLKDAERKRSKPPVDTCETCIYFGKFVRRVKHKGERCELHECDIHPKCFNTKHSIKCVDYTKVL